MENFTAIMEAAINANTCPKFSIATVNGHEVEATVIEQYRRTTGRAKQRPSIMWKVDGKRVAAADLQKATA